MSTPAAYPMALASGQAMIDPGHARRLWELAEHARKGFAAGRTLAAHQAAEVALYDYLFSTSATLRDGLAASCQYLHLLTTNGRLRVESETERETTYSYSYASVDGPGAELALQLSVAMFCARAQAGTGQHVVPVRVGFIQPAPRERRALTELFGSSRIDFGMPVTTFTFRAGDLDRPMLGADPVLARILRQYADSRPLSARASWLEVFRWHLGDAIDDGSPALLALARRLAVSPRTLQRRLADHGTTWRAELDLARKRRASQSPDQSMPRLARQLGYADSRSLRRARRRWEAMPAT
jgi:AraC-like DNA-binding protein